MLSENRPFGKRYFGIPYVALHRYVGSFIFFDDTAGVVVERPTAALCVAGSIPVRNTYLYGLQAVVLGLAVCVCVFSMFVNAPMIHELFLV